MHNLTVYRPKGNLVFGYIALTFVVLFLAQVIFYPTNKSVLVLDVVTAVVLGALATLIWIRPKMVLRETDVLVVNPFYTVAIAYSEITELETKWALLIHHAGKKTRVWVAPASGKQRWVRDNTLRWGFDRMPTADRNETEVTSISQSMSSDSGVAAHLIRERLRSQH